MFTIMHYYIFFTTAIFQTTKTDIPCQVVMAKVSTTGEYIGEVTTYSDLNGTFHKPVVWNWIDYLILWTVLLFSCSFNVGPAHFVFFSTEFYYYLEYGFQQVVNQYKWLEQDLKVFCIWRIYKLWKNHMLCNYEIRP